MWVSDRFIVVSWGVGKGSAIYLFYAIASITHFNGYGSESKWRVANLIYLYLILIRKLQFVFSIFSLHSSGNINQEKIPQFLFFNIHLKHVQTVSALTFSHEKIQHSIKYLWCLLYVTDAIPVNNYFPVLDLTVRCSLQGSSSWDDFNQFSSDDSLSCPVEGQCQFVDHFS